MPELRGPVASMGRQLRAHQWWNHKVPVVLATEYTVLAAGSAASSLRLLGDTVLFLVAVVGVAGFGHVVNDVFDRRPDAAAGKANTTTSLSSRRIAGLVAGLLAVSLAPWIWLPHPALALVLLGAEIVLLTAYAAPPIRLKDRGWAGAVADALYGFVLPIALTAATFAPLARPGLGRAALVAVMVWASASGVRGILVHQREDLDADRAAGTSTWAGRLGTHRTRVVVAVALAIDVGAVVALMVVIRSVVPWAPYLLIVFVAFRSYQVTHLWPEGLPLDWYRSTDGVSHVVGFVFLNEFTSYWFPVLAVATITVRRPALAPLLLAQLALFHTPLLDVMPLLRVEAPRNRARQAVSPMLAIAYVALALSPASIPRRDVVEHLLAAGLVIQGLAWWRRGVQRRWHLSASRSTPSPGNGTLPAPVADRPPDPRGIWPSWASLVGAAMVIAVGCAIERPWASAATCASLAMAAAAVVAVLPRWRADRPGAAAAEVLGRVALPALICWRAVLDEPGVRSDVGWVALAVAWLVVTSWRGVMSRPLSEAWVRDWLSAEGLDAVRVERRRWLVTRVVVPADLACLVVLVFELTRAEPAMAALFVVFLPWCLAATRHRRGGHWASDGDTRTKTLHRLLVVVLGEFAEQWFAPLALGVSVIAHHDLWPLIPLHMVLVGSPVDLLLAPELRDRAEGPMAFVAASVASHDVIPPRPADEPGPTATAAQNSV